MGQPVLGSDTYICETKESVEGNKITSRRKSKSHLDRKRKKKSRGLHFCVYCEKAVTCIRRDIPSPPLLLLPTPWMAKQVRRQEFLIWVFILQLETLTQRAPYQREQAYESKISRCAVDRGLGVAIGSLLLISHTWKRFSCPHKFCARMCKGWEGSGCNLSGSWNRSVGRTPRLQGVKGRKQMLQRLSGTCSANRCWREPEAAGTPTTSAPKSEAFIHL